MKEIYRVTVRLYEDDTQGDGEWEAGKGLAQVLTVADTVEEAAMFVHEAVKEADATEEFFEWRVIAVEKIEGQLMIPKLDRYVPNRLIT